jgi:hypothetical protein
VTSLASALPSLSLKKRHRSASKDGISAAVFKSRKPHRPSALPSLSLKKRHRSASKDGIFAAVLKSRKPHWPSALPSLSLKKRHRSASKDGREFLQHRNNLPPNTGRTSERLALFVLRQGPSVQSVLMPVMGASFKRQ